MEKLKENEILKSRFLRFYSYLLMTNFKVYNKRELGHTMEFVG